MGEFFPNQYWGMDIWKHQELPIIESHDFNFFRCLEFNDGYYGKTVSELHSGNLRLSRKDNRYSNLFPGQNCHIGQIVRKRQGQKSKSGDQVIIF